MNVGRIFVGRMNAGIIADSAGQCGSNLKEEMFLQPGILESRYIKKRMALMTIRFLR
jgi:hypothetical protein